MLMSKRRQPHCCATRQGDTPGQDFRASVAHAFDLSVWQPVHALGILNSSVIVGVMNSNVWLRTLMLATVCSIFGMWQATHSLPALPAA